MSTGKHFIYNLQQQKKIDNYNLQPCLFIHDNRVQLLYVYFCINTKICNE